MNRFNASWSKALVIISTLGTLVCVGVGITVLLNVPGHTRWVGFLLFVLPLVCALFTVRGYVVAPDAILIKRLFWSTRLALNDLRSVEFDAKAMRGSIRTFGNGGMFSFTGYYWNKRLGAYRAYVTDLNNTVVLRLGTKTVVLSPSSPEEFVREATRARH